MATTMALATATGTVDAASRWNMASLRSALPSPSMVAASSSSTHCGHRGLRLSLTQSAPKPQKYFGSFTGLSPFNPLGLSGVTMEVEAIGCSNAIEIMCLLDLLRLLICDVCKNSLYDIKCVAFSPFYGVNATNNAKSFIFLLADNTSFENNFTIIDNGGRVYAMRHGRKVPKLNRPPDQRKALLRGLTTQLLKHGRIKTTRARASAMRKYVDKMITLAKEGSLHKRRQALGFIYEKQIVHALFAEVPDRYGERNGGYTRIIRTLPRRGDNAPMAYIELV
ncbi:hypothetical protein ACLB2K_060720 [Fragaria x ananassa]